VPVYASPQVTGSITSIQASLDGVTWLPLPISVAVPESVALRTLFSIDVVDNLVNVRNVVTLTYGKEVSTFVSEVGTVGTGAYFFAFVFNFPPGLPVGPVMMKNEVQYRLLEGEWKTLDVWEGKFAEISYKLFGRILAVGRRINEVLTPLPFSVPAKEPFTLGMDGVAQFPEAGQMRIIIEIYTPLGEIVTRTITEEVKEPVAITWKVNQPFEFDVPGIYSGRIGLFFNETFLHGIEGGLFDITAVPAPPPAPPAPPVLDITPLIGAVMIFIPMAFLVKLLKE